MGTRYLDLDPAVDRRIFIKGLGLISTGLVMATLGGCESLFDKIANRPVRRRLRTSSADVDDTIAVYKDAVNQMRALPSSDPRSWDAQAAIHGTVAGGFNFCQHGTDHFFSWHRAYLLYFQQICQQLTGEDSFGLPYWNWNQNPDIHPDFTNPTSPLTHPRVNNSVAGNSAFTDATLDTIFGDANFYTFSSQIEGRPHNTAHVVVGGDMVTGGSPLDPVFWAHHCMVDYCWAKWNIELENDNTNDQAWLETTWNHFVDGNGDPIEVSALATILMPLLSYRYESSAIGTFGPTAALTAAEFRTVEERVRKGADVRFEIKRTVPIASRSRISVARPFSGETRVPAGDFAALIESDRARERIFVRINYAMPPSRNDFFVRVFVNLPDANPRTPTEDPHFAGSFAFFGTHGEDHGQHAPKTEFLVYVSDTLHRLRAMGVLRDGEPISVQLVAVPVARQFEREDTELMLEEIDLIVSPVQVRTPEDRIIGGASRMHPLRGWRLLIGVACCLMLLACGSPLSGPKPAGAQTDQEGRTGPLRLDLADRTLAYPIGSGIAEPAKLKFVQVEIGELINPRLLRITFEVRYRPETGADVFLGSFSPLPPDNPGTYIVATRGILRAGGAILLSLVPLDEVGPEDTVEVILRAISFREV